ncbi:MAG: hypothetical protein ACREEZ_05555 [Stellaceae bacterium]
MHDKLGFRDYSHSFEINEGRFDETYGTEGWSPRPRDQAPAGCARS